MEIDSAQWIPGAVPGSSKELIRDTVFTDRSGRVYVHGEIDPGTGKPIVLIDDHDDHEREVADMLRRDIGGEVHTLPRVDKPNGTKCADYVVVTPSGRFYVDLKTLDAADKNTAHNAVYTHRHQANYFIVDVSNVDISDDLIEENFERLFRSNHTYMVKSVAIVRNMKIERVFTGIKNRQV